MMKNKRACAFVVGTRPEAIKLAPVIKAAAASSVIRPVVILTAQHRQMLDQVLDFFSISAHHDLDLMRHDQSLSDLTARSISRLSEVMHECSPAITVVQGDTTTAFCGAYAAFMRRTPVAHVEAGLRSGVRSEPFPEEINRQLIDVLADLYFCATPLAAANLHAEAKRNGVYIVGNTVIDALLDAVRIVGKGWRPRQERLESLRKESEIVLVTIHRRESFGRPLTEILRAVAELAAKNPWRRFVFPVHPNPNVEGPVFHALSSSPNVMLTPPLDYPDFVWCMTKAKVILTDSGGIQEEAPSLGIPVVVARNVTERQEGVDARVAVLAGTTYQGVLAAMEQELCRHETGKVANPYGDGKSSERIIRTIESFVATKPTQ